VADGSDGQVEMFNYDGTHHSTITRLAWGNCDICFNNLIGIYVEDEKIYTIDNNSFLIKIFDLSGNLLKVDSSLLAD
jgi:hypothetical protein